MSEELMPHLDDGEDEFATDELPGLSAAGAGESEPGAPEEAGVEPETAPEAPPAEETPPLEDADEADLTILLAAGAEEAEPTALHEVPTESEAAPEPEAVPESEAPPLEEPPLAEVVAERDAPLMETAIEEPSPPTEEPPLPEAAEMTLLEGVGFEPDEEDMTPVLPAEEEAEPTVLEPVDFTPEPGPEETQIDAPALSADAAAGAEPPTEPIAAADEELTVEERAVEERIVFEEEDETPEWQGTDEMPDWLEADDSTRQHERREESQPTPTSDIFATLADLPGLEPEPSTLIRGRAGRRARKGAQAAPDAAAGKGNGGGFRGRTVVLLIFASVLMCVVILGGLYALYLLTGSVPEQVARFVPPTLGAAAERASSPTPTVTRTPGGEEETDEGGAPGGGVATVTPIIGVTALPTNTAIPQDTPTPIPTATASPPPAPTQAAPTQAAPAQPAAVPTLSAPTLTPSIVNDAEGAMLNGVSMVYVPGGLFTMGSAASGPIHEVTLSPYYVDKTEVTNGQWVSCVAAGACSPPASTRAYDGTPYYGVEAYDDYPVIFVSWYNADSFCHWRGARLPTEAEWEMAARWDANNAVGTLYPWGDSWDNTRLNYCSGGCPLVDSRDTSYDDGWAQAAPVGSFPTGISPAGLLDMSGNVAEWVADRYSAAYYAESPAENPTGPESGSLRVVRGGSWGLSQPALLTATLRSSFPPSSQNGGLGFRCAIAASGVTQ